MRVEGFERLEARLVRAEVAQVRLLLVVVPILVGERLLVGRVLDLELSWSGNRVASIKSLR